MFFRKFLHCYNCFMNHLSILGTLTLIRTEREADGKVVEVKIGGEMTKVYCAKIKEEVERKDDTQVGIKARNDRIGDS